MEVGERGKGAAVGFVDVEQRGWVVVGTRQQKYREFTQRRICPTSLVSITVSFYGEKDGNIFFVDPYTLCFQFIECVC